jgi:LmbE family N-acetylglucosaminyl deacetylase
MIMSEVSAYFKTYFNYIIAKNTLPFSGKSSTNILNPILVIAPHPDDEILGLSGFIIKSRYEKKKIHIIYLTDGENSGTWPDKDEIRHTRINLSEKVCSLLGVPSSNIFRLHLTDGSVPRSGEEGFNNAVETIIEIIEQIKPEVVFTTHSDDYWPFDHVAAAQISKEAVLRSYAKPQLWYFWVWAWYNIRPWQLFGSKFRNLQKIDIRDQLKQKKELSDIYLNSLTPDDKPWSGILPIPLLNAFEYPFEIVEKIL